MLTCIGPPVRTGFQLGEQRLAHRHHADEVLEDVAQLAARSSPRRCARHSSCRRATTAAARRAPASFGTPARSRAAARSPSRRSPASPGTGGSARKPGLLLGDGDRGTEFSRRRRDLQRRRTPRRCRSPSRRDRPSCGGQQHGRSARALRPGAAAGLRAQVRGSRSRRAARRAARPNPGIHLPMERVSRWRATPCRIGVTSAPSHSRRQRTFQWMTRC